MVIEVIGKPEDVCEACVEAYYDEMGPFMLRDATDDDIRIVLVLMGGDTADHICDRMEAPETTCSCACNYRRAEFAN